VQGKPGSVLDYSRKGCTQFTRPEGDSVDTVRVMMRVSTVIFTWPRRYTACSAATHSHRFAITCPHVP